MLLVVGLGNPGTKYARTRHNIGFLLIDELVRRCGAELRTKFKGEFALLDVFGQRLGLLKPQTFMNLSGTSVRPACDFYRIPPSSVLVAHDELDVPFGEVRFKRGGGEAGHNGLRDISRQLGTQDYYRLRLGIGRPPPEFQGKGADYVLQAFAPEEGALLGDFISRGVSAVQAFSEQGAEAAMNEFNRRR